MARPVLRDNAAIIVSPFIAPAYNFLGLFVYLKEDSAARTAAAAELLFEVAIGEATAGDGQVAVSIRVNIRVRRTAADVPVHDVDEVLVGANGRAGKQEPASCRGHNGDERNSCHLTSR